MKTYRIEVDRSLCSGFGACVELAPDLFRLGDDGTALAPAGTGHNPNALEAADACPMGAISVVENAEEAA